MKAADVKVGTRFPYGTILATDCRINDETVVVEWDYDFSIQAVNINDIWFGDNEASYQERPKYIDYNKYDGNQLHESMVEGDYAIEPSLFKVPLIAEYDTDYDDLNKVYF